MDGHFRSWTNSSLIVGIGENDEGPLGEEEEERLEGEGDTDRKSGSSHHHSRIGSTDGCDHGEEMRLQAAASR
jgi:hypothetical protein